LSPPIRLTTRIYRTGIGCGGTPLAPKLLALLAIPQAVTRSMIMIRITKKRTVKQLQAIFDRLYARQTYAKRVLGIQYPGTEKLQSVAYACLQRELARAQ
jgi:hypothetical protein